MLSVLLLAGVLAQSPRQVVLYRGAPLEAQPIRYWAVEDTVLNSSQPDRNYGGEYGLSAGTGKVILIKFGDLERVVGPYQRVVSARLVLSLASNEKPLFHSISQVLEPWGEGPLLTLDAARVRGPQAGILSKQLGKPVDQAAPKWSATWKQRRAGEINWQAPGAMGSADSQTIEGAKMSVVNDQEVVIDGLQDAVQKMADRWYENDGFAVLFDSPAEFASSESPEGRPRLELELERVVKPGGADLSVVRIDRNSDSPDSATFTAHIKNVGAFPASGFSGSWMIQEHEGASTEFDKPLAAGEETTVSITLARRPDKADHTTQPIGYMITPKGPDLDANNDYLEIQSDGAAVDFSIDPKVQVPGPIEDWVQQQVRLLNNTVFARSRFSYAPNGVMERVNVGNVTVGGAHPTPGRITIQLGVPAPSSTAPAQNGSGPVGATASESPLEQAINAFFAVELGAKPAAQSDVVKLAGAPTTTPFSRAPGLLGWGDTRSEGTLASQINLDYQPVYNPIFEGIRPEPTDLLNGTITALINTCMEGGYSPARLTALPRTVLIRALDTNGNALKDTELSFFQSANGSVPDAPASYTATTGATGTVLLGTKPAGDGQANPFGPITDLREGFLASATANGAKAWAWLPAWELFDTASRGNTAAAVFDLYFNLPSAPLETDSNLAKNKLVTDSTGKLPAQLAAIVDQDPATEAVLGDKPGDWVEIDLGRDRPIGEVKLTFKDPTFWGRYDLMVYSTGQKPEEAVAWSREVDFPYSYINASEDAGHGVRSIVYHGMAQRFRFLRIVSRTGGPAKLAEVRVLTVKPAP